MKKQRVCEICAAAASAASSVVLGARRVVLCREHAEQAKAAGAESLDALRAVFIETDGRRALLARRATERRLFPPRPEGRRIERGRRSSDAAGTRQSHG